MSIPWYATAAFIGGFLAGFLVWVWSLCRAAAKACPAPPNCDERGVYDQCGEVFDPQD